jgi:light-regulated signal transduction histidine kinase (bacteriophytochrome)
MPARRYALEVKNSPEPAVAAAHLGMATASPDVLVLVDRNGVIEQLSGDSLGMLGIEAGALVGLSIDRILDGRSSERVVDRLANVIETGPSIAVVLEGLNAVRSNRTLLPVEAVLVVLESDVAAGDSVLVTLRDDRRSVGRRDRERTTRERLESSNRDLEAFAAVAAHDLQEPLRKIRAFSDRARIAVETGETATALDYLERVDAAAVRLQTLLDDLLVLARITGQEPDRRPVELSALAVEVADELMSAFPDAVVDVGEIPVVDADPVRMRQLLTNLLGNSLKYQRSDMPCQIEVVGHREGAWVVLTVTDNGIGFENQYRERIFRPFQRLHGRDEYAGTGVGLALCRAIVERHGGSLVAEGRPGEGATFTVRLHGFDGP